MDRSNKHSSAVNVVYVVCLNEPCCYWKHDCKYLVIMRKDFLWTKSNPEVGYFCHNLSKPWLSWGWWLCCSWYSWVFILITTLPQGPYFRRHSYGCYQRIEKKQPLWWFCLGGLVVTIQDVLQPLSNATSSGHNRQYTDSLSSSLFRLGLTGYHVNLSRRKHRH